MGRPSFRELEQKHRELERYVKKNPYNGQMLQRVLRFVRELAEAGAYISDPRERDYLRTMLRAWRDWVYSKTRKYPPEDRLLPLRPPSWYQQLGAPVRVAIFLLPLLILVGLFVLYWPTIRDLATTFYVTYVVPQGVREATIGVLIPPAEQQNVQWIDPAPAIEEQLRRYLSPNFPSVAVLRVGRSSTSPGEVRPSSLKAPHLLLVHTLLTPQAITPTLILSTTLDVATPLAITPWHAGDPALPISTYLEERLPTETTAVVIGQVARLLRASNVESEQVLRAYNLALQIGAGIAGTDQHPVPDLSPFYRERGLLLADQNRLDEALADLTRAIEVSRNPGFLAVVYGDRARIYLRLVENAKSQQAPLDEQQRYLRAAVDDLSAAIERAPQDLWLYQQRAMAMSQLNTPEMLAGALADWNHLIEMEPTNPDYYFQRALFFYTYRFGDAPLDNTIADLHQAIEISASSTRGTPPAYRVYLALCYLARGQAGDQDSAEETLKAVLTAVPDLADAHFLLGRLYAEQGLDQRTALVQRLYQEGSPLSSTGAEQTLRAIYALWDQAIEHLDQALAHSDQLGQFPVAKRPIRDSYFLRGKMRVLREESAPALDDLSAAFRRDPTFVRALLWRAKAYRQLGRYEEALADLAQVIQDPSLAPEALVERAFVHLDQAIATGQSSAVEQAAGELLSALQKAPSLAAEVWLALSRYEDPAATYVLGRFYRSRNAQGDLQSALDAFNQAEANGFASADLFYRRGLTQTALAQQSDDPDEQLALYTAAEEDFTRAFERDSTRYDALYHRGLVRLKLGADAWPAAVQDFQTVIEKAPELRDQAYYGLGTAYYLMGDYEAAYAAFTGPVGANPAPDQIIAHLTDLLSNPDMPEKGPLYYLRGEAYRSRAKPGDLKAAISDFTRALSLGAGSIAYYGRGRAYFDLGDYEAALADFQRAQKLPGYEARVTYWIGRTYHALGDRDRAVEYLQAALEYDPQFTPAYLALGSIYLEQAASRQSQGDTEGADAAYAAAYQVFDQAVQLDPNSAEAYVGRGRALFREGSVESPKAVVAALDNFSQAITLQFDYASAYYYRALCYAWQGDYQDALVDLNTALSLSPGDPQILFHRGRISLLSGDPEGAIADLTQALENDLPSPYQPDAYFYRAMALIQRGQEDDLKRAIQDLSTTIQLDPAYEEAYYRRGILYDREGALEAALRDLETYLKLAPEGPYSEDAEKRIADLRERLEERNQPAPTPTPQE